jgi:acylphosphatase
MNQAEPTICRHLSIHGQVQGVGFRWSLAAEAQQRGLSGWVRNRRDGSVEALIFGTSEAVQALTTWAHQGPPSAVVERVASSERQVIIDAEIPTGFEQRPTL